MIIKSITLNNYRLYKGENTLSLSSSDEKNIVLISGENGFGKTTFLHSLIWCLYGKLMIEVEVEIRKDINSNGYNSYLQPIITQYFIDNKSEIWLLFLIAHSKR